MKIKSLTIGGLLSFGPEQVLDGFADFNLLIGPNGSGKSNILQILDGLPFNMKRVSYDVTTAPPSEPTALQKDTLEAYIPAFIELSNTVINKDTWMSPIPSKLIIEYENPTDSTHEATDKHKIIFEENDLGLLTYQTGDVVHFANQTKLIELTGHELEHFRDLSLFLGSENEHFLPILNFGLYYIFQLHYNFKSGGQFTQGKVSRGGRVENSMTSLPSGVAQVVKCITKLLMASDASVWLIDEPEVHLEPRIIRRYFEFLVWLSVRLKELATPAEKHIFQKVEEFRVSPIRGTNSSTIFGEMPDFGCKLQGKQLFIASHSSVLINEFLKLSGAGRIFQFWSEERTYVQQSKLQSMLGITVPSVEKNGLFAMARRVEKNSSQVLDGLGCSGADLLQCNGVIWVEGPSDIIFIEKWLSMYARKNKETEMVKGVCFEFQMFAGTLLDSLYLIHEGSDPDEEHKKLVSMLSFSRNAYIIIDSDAVRIADGTTIDKSYFFNAKRYIKNQITELNRQGYNLGLWFDQENTKFKTVEDYLDEESKEIGPTMKRKKLRAQRIVNTWGNVKKMTDFSPELQAEIRNVYDTIKSWQN